MHRIVYGSTDPFVVPRWPPLEFMIDTRVYYTARFLNLFSYRTIFLSFASKYNLNQTKVPLTRRLLRRLEDSCRSKCLPVRPLSPRSQFMSHLFKYCHIHISCILLHCYCTGLGYSGARTGRRAGLRGEIKQEISELMSLRKSKG